MYDVIHRLGVFLLEKKTTLRSHYYRHQDLLRAPCSSIPLTPFDYENSTHLKLLRRLTQSPIHSFDFELNDERALIQSWLERLPQDPKFYQKCEEQLKLVQKYSDSTIKEFLLSKDGRVWLQKRKKLKRKPLYELDLPYKASKRAALSHEFKVQELIRANPLLRWSDLKDLKIRNAQVIFERFPERELHRRNYLLHLQSKLVDEEVSQSLRRA